MEMSATILKGKETKEGEEKEEKKKDPWPGKNNRRPDTHNKSYTLHDILYKHHTAHRIKYLIHVIQSTRYNTVFSV